MDATRTAIGPESLDDDGVKDYLRSDPDILRLDGALLNELGLRLDVANVVDFGPVALSRVTAAHLRESNERRRLEAVAEANYLAQAQTHAAVIDLLEARNLPDLARRIDDLSRLRFGLAAGVLALEGPGGVPAGWRAFIEGQIDLILGPRRLAVMGHLPTALGLFGDMAPQIASVALIRLAIWDPARQGLIAFGSIDPEGFSDDMGPDLVTFLARVTERTAERWPSP